VKSYCCIGSGREVVRERVSRTGGSGGTACGAEAAGGTSWDAGVDDTTGVADGGTASCGCGAGAGAGPRE
jgi:hypothetical protein